MTAAGPAVNADELYEGFRRPPAEARPFVRWWWNGNCVTEKEILRELDLLKAAGVGGVEINPIAMPDWAPETVAEPLEWLSPQWNRMVKVAADGAKQRGMIADLIGGSGWPFGGRFLKRGQMLQRAAVAGKTLTGPGVFSGHTSKLIESPATLLLLRLAPHDAKHISSFTDLMDSVKPDGSVRFEIPAGRHTLYAGSLHEGFKSVTHGAAGADGPVLDHYNRPAVEAYLERMSKSLGPVLGGQLGDSLRAVFCDSIELSGANWTNDLPREFEKRRGYSLDPYLPLVLAAACPEPVEVAGPEGDSPFADTVRRVRYDFSRLLVELFHERFIHAFHGWCRRNGVLSRYQAYGGPWLMGMLAGYMVPDIPEGDTWLYHPRASVGVPLDKIRYAVWNKYASSGAHLTGKRLVGCEAMTNLGGVFRATLEEIKQAGDLNFITGVNHSILHGFNYSPPDADFPGWVRYGTWFSERNPWWPYFRKWADYNARLSWVFQHARPQVEVAILGPTADVWGQAGLERTAFINTPWYLHQLWQAIHQNGWSADYVNAAVLGGATFKDGKLQFGPTAYDVLIVAGVHTLAPQTARAIEKYARAGGKIVFVQCAPSRSAGLKGAAGNDKAVSGAIAAALRIDPKRVAVVPGPKKGSLLAWAAATLAKFRVRPAVKISAPNKRLFQIHHRLDGRDVFFFANLRRGQAARFQASFATGNSTPWCWDPQTGRRSIFPHGQKKSELTIRLGPLESLLLVFEPVRHGGRRRMPGKEQPRAVIDRAKPLEIAGPWRLTLKGVRGGPTEITPAKLVDLGKEKDERLNTFGGMAVYRAEFDIADTKYGFLDLGRVHGVSDVKLNGKALGVRWWGRHLYAVADALQPGVNVLEVKVATVLANYCRSLKNNPTTTRWSRGHKAAPAGLVGPVRLFKAK